MRNILSIILSFILFLQPLAFAGSEFDDASYARGRRKKKVAEYSDTSFFSVPRLSAQDIEEQCSGSINKMQKCDGLINAWKTLADQNNPLGIYLYQNCHNNYGSDGGTPKNACVQNHKYGVNRASAWDAYVQAKNPWKREGEYWQLTPAELYYKYEQVAKDMAVLWDINPEYKEARRQDKFRRWTTGIIVGIIAFKIGTIVAPILAAEGFPMGAKMISLTAFRAEELISPLKFLISDANKRFLVDLGLLFSFINMDRILVDSAFFVMFKLTEELQVELQNNLDTGYTIEVRNLLLEIIDPLSKVGDTPVSAAQEQGILTFNQEFTDEIKEALQEQTWTEDTSKGRKKHREAVATLYALEYIRAEMADLTEPYMYRYREAAIDIAQVYFGKELYKDEENQADEENEEEENTEDEEKKITDLNTDRYAVYLKAKNAHDARLLLEKQRREDQARTLIEGALAG